MEVRTGDKQTDVGVIPEDWNVTSIGSLGYFSKGRGISKDETASGTIPCIRYGEIYTRHNDIIKFYYSWISPEVSSQSRKLKKGDLLFTGSGETKQEIGKCVAFLDDKDVYAGGDIVILSPTFGDSRFLGYLLNSTYVAQQKASRGQGDAIVHITSSALSGIIIALPPTLTEQQAIAEALSDVDALIESLEQLIAKKRLVKQGAMQELLTGKRRLPGFDKKDHHKKTLVGIIPEDWTVMKLGECLLDRPEYGINAPAVPYDDSAPTYIRITDITEDGFFSPENLVSVKHANADRYFLREGDIVFARTGASVGKSYLYNRSDGPLVFAGFLIKIRVDPSFLLPAFLASYVRTGFYWDWVKVMSMRSGQPGINGNEYAQLPVPVPPVSEQNSIVVVLSDMDSEIAGLEEKLEKARKIKQGMMQELLTGRIRLV